MYAKLDEVENKYELIQQKLQEPGVTNDQKKYRQLTKELADLQVIVDVYRDYKKTLSELKSAVELLSQERDDELKKMIKEEIQTLEKSVPQFEERLRLLLLPKDPNDDKNVILEIRAGAGGDEASLFAEELFRAYSLFAGKLKWRMEILSISPGNVGGYKEVIASVSGDRVYSILKFESGVHRVQRVPETEASGRIHTSTVTVAVIPEAEEIDVKIDPKDLRIDVFRSSGHGGQSVNTTDSAVRVTHLPTGMVVSCQDGKSQLSNKQQALKVLYSRLLALEEEKRMKEASEERLAQIGTGDRSERIRTYNFPQSRCTDHRIGFTTHQLGDLMSGNLHLVVDPVIAHFQAEALRKQTENGR